MSRKRKGRKLKGATDSMVRTPAPPWVHWVIALLVALVTFVAFLPSLHNGFVNWDDDDNLLNNPHYRGLGSAQPRWMWTTLHMGHWIPLTWRSFGLDYVLWGMNPVGYHLTSLTALVRQGKGKEASAYVNRLETALSRSAKRGESR